MDVQNAAGTEKGRPQMSNGPVNGLVNGHESNDEKVVKESNLNAWSHPGPAAFDFRSDVVTTPTPAMLASIAQTTLQDDVFGEDPTTNHLESYIAHLTSHEGALLVLSGTMGNQLALRTHLTQPPHSVLTDHRSHILEWEAGGVASLSGALVKGIEPSNGHHITLSDVKRHAVLTDDVHAAPTRVISLENTLGGQNTPLEDCRAISTWAKSKGIKTHLDGARLWEAISSNSASKSASTNYNNNESLHTINTSSSTLIENLQAYSACFDSLSLCFSKGLGAPLGSILVGSTPFIRKARHIRKSIGGGLRQTGVIAAPALVAVRETFLGGRLAASHSLAERIGDMWTSRGGRLSQPVETNMVWLDLGSGFSSADQDHGSRKEEEEEEGEEREEDSKTSQLQKWIEAGLQNNIKVSGGRLVIHYQICEEAVQRLGKVMDGYLDQSRQVSLQHGDANGNGSANANVNGNGNGNGHGHGHGINKEAEQISLKAAEME